MGLEKKLAAWSRAKLITQKQSRSIAEFEKSRAAKNHLFSYLFLVMAVLFCLWGIVSIVAYNWDDIPKFVKLGTALAALAGSVFGILAAGRRKSYLWHEAAILAHAGLIACNIALVAQIYQLDSDPTNGAMLWAVLALPALLVSKGPWLCWGWLGVVLYVVGFKSVETYHFEFKDFLLASGAVGILLFLKYFAIMKTGLYAQFAKVFKGYSFALLAINAGMMEFFWHDCAPVGNAYIAAFATLLAAFAFLTREAKERGLRYFALGAYALFIVLFIPANAETYEVSWIFRHETYYTPFLTSGFLYTTILLCLALWSLYRARRPKLFNAAFALLSLRLTIFMFDRFGSLLLRGFGFIAAGLMFLGFFKLWRDLSAGISKGKRK
ncbi:MAG: DUF2157 domain-containing protein [Rickettsiales bacterium]|jgi:uncharacterized membrane protein|nr:DUF2157 domain-containing protein [Rickettsiales bacterium]